MINDVGPFIPGTALRRLGVYLNAPPPRFDDLAAAEDYIRTTLAPFGALTDDHWRHLTEHSVRPDGDGGLLRHHEPGIAEAYRPWRLGSIMMWHLWDKVRCPTLLLRGTVRPCSIAIRRGGIGQLGADPEALQAVSNSTRTARVRRCCASTLMAAPDDDGRRK